MSRDFPEYACPYALKLAESSPRFALQVFDEKGGQSTRRRKERFGVDPFGELTKASKVKGLKQRFPDRVLIMTTEMCFVACRHCTRQGLFGKTETVESPQDLARCVDYVKAHPKVRDVLLSGGDILTLPDKRVMEFVDAFAALDQVEMVRVCTRALCANPARWTG